MPPSHWFWAKLGTDTWPGRFHPLVCHALDVGHVAAGLWGQSRPPLRRRIAAALGCDDLAAGRWLSFWIAAHDIGKLTPGFQEKGKTADLRARLPAEFNWGVGDQHHTETGTKILVDALPKGVARKVAVAVGGHHGTFPTGWEGHSDVLGSAGWAAARQGLLATLARLFGVDDSAAPNPPASIRPRMG